MDFEYVAISMRDIGSGVRAILIKQGWEEYLQAPWHSGGGFSKGICIMRRPKDEPRMWTRTQVENIALNMVLKNEGWGSRSGGCPNLDIQAAKEARGHRD